MNPRLLILALLLSLLSPVMAHDPYAGMEAARRMGQTKCLAYSWKGRAETAAVFKFGGHDWICHPTTGSVVIDGHNPLEIPGSVWTPVHCVPSKTNIENGDWACLPLAIAEQKKRGGRVAIYLVNGRQHAKRIP